MLKAEATSQCIPVRMDMSNYRSVGCFTKKFVESRETLSVKCIQKPKSYDANLEIILHFINEFFNFVRILESTAKLIIKQNKIPQ